MTALALASCPAGAQAAVPASCPGQPISPTRVITGEFGAEQQGAYVMVPFDVPAGTTQVRLKYCWDQPEAPTSAAARHTIDLGLYQPRRSGGGVWGPAEFRGWGGSSHPDVAITPEGFSTEAQYQAAPKGYVPTKTTRGFVPGPIPAGRWAAELGVAGVVPQNQGDVDGKVAWRVEIELTRNPAATDQPYRPAAYDARPARGGPGWYAGDFHVHGEHSSLGDATMTEVFNYAFSAHDSTGPRGLDFVTLSDYVTKSHYGEIGRYQPRHRGRLIVRSAEVITYRGHVNNHGTVTHVDYRTGPVLERRDNGSLALLRGARPARGIMAAIRAAGGWSQINHPTTFPSTVPIFALLCRGCSWEYSPAETDYGQVDAIEVATGPAGLQGGVSPGPNPFTPLAIQFWENALAGGQKIAAVGSSDSHNAGRTGGGAQDAVTQSPIGHATTVVYAQELSEAGLRCGVRRGNTYVKLFGNSGPDLRFEARPAGAAGPVAIMGDTLRAPAAAFQARVLGAASGGEPYELLVFKDGNVISTTPVIGTEFSFPFASQGPGRYRLQLQRGGAIHAVSSAIYLEGTSGAPSAAPSRPVSNCRYAAPGRGRGRGGAGSITSIPGKPGARGPNGGGGGGGGGAQLRPR